MASLIAWCTRQLDLRKILIGLSVAALAGSTDRAALAADPIGTDGATVGIQLDQAKIVKMPERTATLVVGNPLIADVSVQPGGIMVITGKSYGMTNVIALGRGGEILMDHSVEVSGPSGNIVMVYRGIERESYSCTPKCERRITLGDTPGYFTANLTQSGTLNAQALGSVQPPK
jgi:predicted secreted protein